MEEIYRQVSVARRRLLLQQFIQLVSWCMFGTFAIALIGLAIPKLWVLPIDEPRWTTAWLAGAAVAGLLAGGMATWWARRGALDAALELDRRFGLKERVSSALALAPEDLQTDVGRALLDDAARRVAKLEVRDQFRVSVRRHNFWFLIPAALAFVLAFLVPGRSREAANAAAKTAAEAQQRVKKSTETLKKRVEQQRKQAEERGLSEAEVMFQRLAQGLDELQAKDDVDRKKALIKLNDLSKELEERRKQLGASDKMREQLQQLKQMKHGPADKMLSALKEGDFGKAMDQVKELSDKVKNGELSEAEKQQLVEQLKAMKEKLESMSADHNQAKEDLKRQMEQKMAEGDTAAAGKLQRQLDALNSKDQQMQSLQQLAGKMGQIAESVQKGEGKEASAQLDRLAAELDQMRGQLSEMESIDSVLDQIAQAKDSMNCPECDGLGCEQCQAMGQFSMSGMRMRNGRGMGAGQGEGDRPEQETDTSFYQSQVRDKPKGGEAVLSGQAAGPNRSGISREEIKRQIESSLTAESDPLTEQRLPRTQRDHAKEYFEALRKGE